MNNASVRGGRTRFLKEGDVFGAVSFFTGAEQMEVRGVFMLSTSLLQLMSRVPTGHSSFLRRRSPAWRWCVCWPSTERTTNQLQSASRWDGSLLRFSDTAQCAYLCLPPAPAAPLQAIIAPSCPLPCYPSDSGLCPGSA